ncbi:MAG: UbiD family decarboxylase [Ignavibacteriales bacterium]
MPNPSLGDYLRHLEAEHPEEVLRIKEVHDADYVVTAMALEMDRRKQFLVMIVENPYGRGIPLVWNIFADRDRVGRLIGGTSETIPECYSEREEHPIKPVMVQDGPVKEVIEKGADIDLTRIPVMKHFASDAGRYITSGLFVCKDPDTGIRNMSFHRLQVKGPDRLGISLHSRRHAWDYLRRAEERGEDLEAAIVIGCHPGIVLGASAKGPIELDEYDIAGAVLGEPVELVKCETVDIEVPATAEIVVEGKILANVREPEGPFGEYSGYSTSRSTQHVFQVTSITRRKSPIYYSIVPGRSSDHLNLMHVAIEAFVKKRLKEKIPTLKALCFPKSGADHHCYISMKKTAEGLPKQALLLLLGLEHLTRLAVVVDEDINVFDEDEVLWAVATSMHAERDLFMIQNVFAGQIDPAATQGCATKIGIDATRPLTWDVVRPVMPEEAMEKARAILKQVRW